jgi:serine/threonine protein kinase
MSKFGGWEPIEPALGRGGQGTVYKARGPQRAAAITDARRNLLQAIKTIPNIEKTSPRPDPEALLNTFVSAASELSRPDLPTELGALKIFDIPSDGSAEAQTAAKRLEREVEALRSVPHPGILRLIDANVNERWFVAEYHPGRTLADNRERYRGDALSGLKAFRTIVDGVAQLHENRYVHRDIKSNNVFVGRDNQLVLGDFGIVFYEDPGRTRLTEDYERVGSRDWMAPWAHVGVRVDDVRPTFDVFPLGKLLWSMISGQRILPPYYTHRSATFNLEEMFPDRRGMEQVNSILDKCIVTEERNCLQSAVPLRDIVDKAVATLEEEGTFQQIVLVAPDGGFRVRVTAGRFQLNATPLVRNQNGEWVAHEDAVGPIGPRWQLQPNGNLLRFQ